MRALHLLISLWPPVFELRIVRSPHEFDVLGDLGARERLLLHGKEEPKPAAAPMRRMIFPGITFKREDPYGV